MLKMNLDDKCGTDLAKYFPFEFGNGYVECEGFVLPKNFQNIRDQIRGLEVRSEDIWVCSFPKSVPELQMSDVGATSNSEGEDADFSHETALKWLVREHWLEQAAIPDSRGYRPKRGLQAAEFEGTSWTQEAAWCIANNADLEAAKKRPLRLRFPFLEGAMLRHDRKPVEDKSVDLPQDMFHDVVYIDELPSPRFIKSHLLPALLPTKLLQNETNAKIVYVIRNPRDTCISYYHFSLMNGYTGDFETFCHLFMKGTGNYLPYWKHVLQYWRIRENPNVLLITNEEMKKDLKAGILKIAKFLGKTLADSQISQLTEHLSFEKMKDNRMVNSEPEAEMVLKYAFGNVPSKGMFMRCGRAGQWRDVMTPSMVERFHVWESENLKEVQDFPIFLDA